MTQSTFNALSLQANLLRSLDTLGYLQMTPIQAQSLPLILAGNDLIAQAKTGSGKTAAFGLGLLEKIDAKVFRAQAMVLCPTRELADQVANEIRKLARGIPNIKVLCLTGGKPLSKQARSIEFGVHIVVGTPGRIEDHLEKQTLKTDFIQTLVLDEADRMLDMGFTDVINKIVNQLPKARQTLLFSATFPDQIEAMSKRIMKSPKRVKVDNSHDNTSIEQHFYQVQGENQRLLALQTLLLHHRPESSLVFCNTKVQTQKLAAMLSQQGFSALALNGDLEQKDRDQTLVQFANKSAAVLIATDVAARGLDIESVDMVINYEVANDPEVHVHRIGRTGRAGAKGLACTLFSEAEFHRVTLLEGEIDPVRDGEALPTLAKADDSPITAKMRCIEIASGRKHKIRAGDILGALTAGNDVQGSEVGKIHLFDERSFVAVELKAAERALSVLKSGKLKGRRCLARLINNY